MDSEYINKLPIDGSNDNFLIWTKWGAESVEFEIIDLSKTSDCEYSGQLNISELKEISEELEISFENFLSECKRALCTNGGLAEFNYIIEDNTFSWRRIEDFKITYGSVQLSSSIGAKTKLLENSINLIESLNTTVKDLKSEADSSRIEHRLLLESYEKCISQKNAIEKELLAKFAILLNSKKLKIAELQELLLEKEFPQNSKKRKTPDVDDYDTTTDEEGDGGLDFSQATQIIPPKRLKMDEQTTSNHEPSQQIDDENSPNLFAEM